MLSKKIQENAILADMKIISLNIWGGRAGREKVLDFFATNKDIDIFCLQEVWSKAYHELEGVEVAGRVPNHSLVMTEVLQDISKVLIDHTAYFRPHYGDNYGLALLVKSPLGVVEEGEIFVYKEKEYIPEGDPGEHARNLQYVKIRTEGKEYTVLNFHGLWNGQGKGDSPDRIAQSEKIISFLEATDSKRFVLCGDFNLSPDTESINMLVERLSAHNLIAQYGITSTRTPLYMRENRFADYVFTGGDITVKDFKVLPDEVSDHAPLYVEVE
jgi:endonuclease/exonuclease/phosphatase family metal-dependent hydrolase